MPPRRNRPRRGRPDPDRHEPVANFPAPQPPADTSATATVGRPLFADMRSISLSQIERAIMRDAFTFYIAALHKREKSNREMGLPVDAIKQRIAIINGGDGLGVGIYSKLTEQMTIGEQAQLVLEDERRSQEAEAVACRDVVMKLDEMPAGRYEEQLLTLVRSWSSEKRAEAIEYATTVNALPEGETFTGAVPPHIRTAVDRATEWTMTNEEIERWVAAGPWRIAWFEDSSKKTFWYAMLQDREEGLFETEGEARRCVARLNRLASADAPPASDPPPATTE